MTSRQITDAELAVQAAAYWTGAAYEALIAFARARQAEPGFTQPQYWLLRNLSKNDISPDGHGMTVTELQRAMGSCLRAEDDLEAEADVLLERGWLTRDAGGRLWITEGGRGCPRRDEAARAGHPRPHPPGNRRRRLRHRPEGLRRMIRNKGGTPVR